MQVCACLSEPAAAIPAPPAAALTGPTGTFPAGPCVCFCPPGIPSPQKSQNYVYGVIFRAMLLTAYISRALESAKSQLLSMTFITRQSGSFLAP